MRRGRQQRVGPADLKEPIAMADVVAVGVSLRSLQDAFTRPHGWTLMQCIQRRRLECWRAVLAGARQLVSSIAHTAGLGHRGCAADPLSEVSWRAPPETMPRRAR
jgi:transcriptional regulator GlxA family with amidase domain